MILWQNAKKYQNCVGGDTADHHQIDRHQPSNPPNTILITWNNSSTGVYNPEFQGESGYQLWFSIGLIVLWQNAKNTQNCVQIKLKIPLQSHFQTHVISNFQTHVILIFRGGVYDLITYEPTSNHIYLKVIYIR
jgi:hypothetical protein